MKTLICATAFGFLILLSGCEDPVTGPFLMLYGSHKVEDYISEMKKNVDKAVANAGNTASSSINHMSNEANVLAANLDIMLDKQREKLVKDLSDHEIRALKSLYDIQQQMGDVTDKVLHTADLVVLDLEGLSNRVPLIEDADFYVRRIEGMLQVRGIHDYQMKLVGPKLGMKEALNHISFKIDNIDLPVSLVNGGDVHTSILNIPNLALNIFFDDSVAWSVPANLNCAVSRQPAWWKFWASPEIDTFKVDLNLNLYPATAGSAEIMAFQPREGYNFKERIAHTEMGPEAHCPKNCKGWGGVERTYTYPVNYNQSVGNLDGSCLGGHLCGWTGPIQKHVDNGGKRATFVVRNYTHAQAFRFSYDLFELGTVGVDTMLTRVNIPLQRQLEIAIPESATDARVVVRLVTGDTVDFTLGKNDTHDVLSFTDRTTRNGVTFVRYDVSDPMKWKVAGVQTRSDVLASRKNSLLFSDAFVKDELTPLFESLR